MWSSRRQRRKLRAIEQTPAGQDRHRAERPARTRTASEPLTVADGVARVMFCLAVLLLTAGLVLLDSGLLKGAVVVLVMLPPVVLLVAGTSGRH